MTIVVKGKVIRSDLNLYNGSEESVSRRDSTGGAITSLPINDFVDVLHVYGRGVSFTRSVIQDAVNKIGVRNRTVRFNPGTWEIDDNLTIPSNITSYVPAGAVFNVASGKTLTFNGPVIRESDTWTSGSGTATPSADSSNALDFLHTASGAQSRELRVHLVDRPVLATDFGLNADGVTDDATPLTNAIAAAIANDSRKVILPFATIALASEITINTSGVELIGAVVPSNHDVGTLVGTILLWTGSSGGTMMTIAPTEGASNQRLDGNILRGIAFNCNHSAAKGLVIKSVRRGLFDIYQQNATGTGLELGVVTTLGEARDLQFNTFRYASRNIGSTGAGGVALRLTGDATANTSMNIFERIDIAHSDAFGIIEENADSNLWLDVRILRASGGTATNSIEWRGSDIGQAARGETFYYLTTTVAAIARGTASFTTPADRIVIHTLGENATPDPTIETGASVHWNTAAAIAHFWAFKKLAVADSEANANTARSAMGTESLRIHNGSSNHVVLTNGTETWNLNINAATGDLRIVRAAGTGSLLLPSTTQFNAQTITKGANDTGGAGFAALVVPN